MSVLCGFEKALLSLCEVSGNEEKFYDAVSAAVEILGGEKWTFGFGEYAPWDTQPADANSLIGSFAREFGQEWHEHRHANADLALLALFEQQLPHVFWYEADKHLRLHPDVISPENDLFELAMDHGIYQGFSIRVPLAQNHVWAAFSIVVKAHVSDDSFTDLVKRNYTNILRLAKLVYAHCPFGLVNKQILGIGDEALKVLLRRAKGMSIADISQDLQKNHKNVETLLGNARRKLFRNEWREEKVTRQPVTILREQVLRKKLDTLWADFHL